MASGAGAGYQPQWAVYRCYEASGRLLYVGSSRRFHRRLAWHETTAWFAHVTVITLEWFGSAEDAVEAEALAIARENPVVNRQGITRPRLPPAVTGPGWRSEGLPHPGHGVLARLLDEAGPDGITPAQAFWALREAGAGAARETVQRWLTAEVRAGRASQPQPGRYRR